MWIRRDCCYVTALIAIYVGGVALITWLVELFDLSPIALLGVIPVAAVWLIVFFKWIPLSD